MAESPTLLFRDALTGGVLAWSASDASDWTAATQTLVDEEGHRMDVPHAELWGDFARYRLFGIDLPEGVVLVRLEDGGAEKPFTLEDYETIESPDPQARTPWRATFAASNGERLVLREDELLEGLQEWPPVYRFG